MSATRVSRHTNHRISPTATSLIESFVIDVTNLWNAEEKSTRTLRDLHCPMLLSGSIELKHHKLGVGDGGHER